MIRKEVFDIYNLRHIKYYEDFNLWYQASKVTAIATIPRVLVHYRLFDTEQKLHHRQIKEDVVQLIFRKKLLELGIHVPEEEFNDFAKFMKGFTTIDSKKYKQYRAWLLYDRLRLWKFYYKSEKANAILALGGISGQILCNFDCLRILLRNF
jgi:hypothetical protein